jgi:hypothetical protein
MGHLSKIELFLPLVILFSGCYTILLVEPTNETACNPDPVQVFEPLHSLDTDYRSPLPPLPHPLQPLPISVTSVDNQSSTPPQTDDQREVHTGRGPVDSNAGMTNRHESRKSDQDTRERRGGR